MDFDELSPTQLEQLANAIFSSNRALNLGPFILGAVIDALLCGILLMQYGSYISSGSRDHWSLRFGVTYVIAMNLWDTTFAWAWTWYLFVENFGVYRAFFSVKYLSWDFVINTASVFAVQTFYVFRAWKVLGKSRVFGICMLGFMVASLGSGIAIKILYSRYEFILYANKLKVPAYVGLSSMVIVDVSITSVILCYIVCSRGVSERTDHILARVARVTFESQLPPTLVAIAILAIYSIKNDSFVMVPLIWIQPKFYGISLLHTLNARATMQQPSVIFGTSFTPSSHVMNSRRTRFSMTAPTYRATHPDEVTDSVTDSNGPCFQALDAWHAPQFRGADENCVTSTSGCTLHVEVETIKYSSNVSSSTSPGSLNTRPKNNNIEVGN